jgi:hypothetical protein
MHFGGCNSINENTRTDSATGYLISAVITRSATCDQQQGYLLCGATLAIVYNSVPAQVKSALSDLVSRTDATA